MYVISVLLAATGCDRAESAGSGRESGNTPDIGRSSPAGTEFQRHSLPSPPGIEDAWKTVTLEIAAARGDLREAQVSRNQFRINKAYESLDERLGQLSGVRVKLKGVIRNISLTTVKVQLPVKLKELAVRPQGNDDDLLFPEIIIRRQVDMGYPILYGSYLNLFLNTDIPENKAAQMAAGDTISVVATIVRAAGTKDGISNVIAVEVSDVSVVE